MKEFDKVMFMDCITVWKHLVALNMCSYLNIFYKLI